MKMEPSNIKNVFKSKGHLIIVLVYGLFEVNYYFWNKENILKNKIIFGITRLF